MIDLMEKEKDSFEECLHEGEIYKGVCLECGEEA